MRIHPVDGLLFLSMKLLKSLDRRETDLKHFGPDRVKNILVVSSTAIGDTLLSTPAIRAVRERYPDANIVAHFNIKNMELFKNNPHINGIIPYYGGYKKFIKTIREFRKYKFDLAFIFHGNEPQATPMAYLSGARFIIKVPRSKEYGFLLSNARNGFDNPWDHHAIEVRLKAASFAGCKEDNKSMVLVVDKDDKSLIDNYLKTLCIPEDAIIVGLQVGAAKKYKAWPERNFIELGKRIVSGKQDFRIILTGSEDEKSLCDSIAEGIGEGAVSVAGGIPLKRLRALIKEMDILVTNDTGPMHMAVALHTKTVSLFCPTNYRGVGPVQDPHRHRIIHEERPCNPCITKKCKNPFCMELITVDEVYEAVMGLLSRNLTFTLNHVNHEV